MSESQRLWEQIFIATLAGAAREPWPPEKDAKFMLNRAEARCPNGHPVGPYDADCDHGCIPK